MADFSQFFSGTPFGSWGSGAGQAPQPPMPQGPQVPPEVIAALRAKLGLDEPTEAQTAMTHQPEQPNPAAPTVEMGKLIGKHFWDKAVSAATAPRDAFTGAMQVTDPETGMPTREAMERGQDVANMAMTGGIPFAQRGAAGMAGGRLAQPGGAVVESGVTKAPQVFKMFHGTDETFNAFDPAKMGANYGDHSSMEGFHFAENKNLAKSFGKNVLERNIETHNPKIIDVESALKDDYDIAVRKGDFRGPFDKYVSDHLEGNPYAYYERGMLQSDIEAAKSAGHDALILDFGKLKDADYGKLGRTAVAFNPEQIKEAGIGERIIGASYTAAGKHYVAPNHVLAMDQAVKDLGLTGTSDLVDLHGGFEGHHAANGFMTSTGRVVNRTEADRIANAAEQGQSSRPGSLKSEDMKTGTLSDFITAYHGSPHDFDRFDLSKIGTGEGAQAYGHGLYFAENEGVAKGYRDTLGPVRGKLPDDIISLPPDMRKAIQAHADSDADPVTAAKRAQYMSSNLRQVDLPKVTDMIERTREAKAGKMYQVAIKAPPEHFLDWDKPLSEQGDVGKKARDTLAQLRNADAGAKKRIHGMTVEALSQDFQDPQIAQKLREAGIPGIKYLDQGSRGLGSKDKIDDLIASTLDAVGGNRDKAIKELQGRIDSSASLPVQYRANNPQLPQAIERLKQGWSDPRTRNYVVFDDKIIDILKKYGIAGIGALPAMNAYHYQDKGN